MNVTKRGGLADWKAFELYIWKNWWLRNFSAAAGWESQHCKPLLGGRLSVDFAAWKGNFRVVGDAKDRLLITYDDLEKLIDDAGIFRASRLILLIAADTQLPNGVRQYSRTNWVEVIRTNGDRNNVTDDYTKKTNFKS